MAKLRAIGRMYLSQTKVLQSEAYLKIRALTLFIMAWRAITL
jgi:hypothetical protein